MAGNLWESRGREFRTVRIKPESVTPGSDLNLCLATVISPLAQGMGLLIGLLASSPPLGSWGPLDTLSWIISLKILWGPNLLHRIRAKKSSGWLYNQQPQPHPLTPTPATHAAPTTGDSLLFLKTFLPQGLCTCWSRSLVGSSRYPCDSASSPRSLSGPP